MRIKIGKIGAARVPARFLRRAFPALLALFFAAGCAATRPPGGGLARSHPWIMGSEMTRLVVSSYGDGRPSRVEYYREGHRLAVEEFDDDGSRVIEGRVPDGLVREYHGEGRLRAEVPFRGGLRHGTARYYHEEGGMTEARVEWREGIQDGLTRIFRSDGTLRFEEMYEAGALRQRRAYTPDGEIIYVQEF